MARKRPPAGIDQICGLLNLYKPSGITSMEAVRRIKRLAGPGQKVGHGGTMDPMARGVLPICFGQATRLMEYVVGGRKRYRLEVLLGVATDTYDAEGRVVETSPVSHITPVVVSPAINSFVGSINQTPPMYSAVKVNGQRLYKLARAGVEVERQPRPVEIYSIEVLEWDLPRIVMEVESGPGVYIRSLAHDLGQLLGCGGHVTELERLYCGGFDAKDSLTLETLQENPGSQDWRRHLLPTDWLLRSLRTTVVSASAERLLLNGQAVAAPTPMVDAGYAEEFRAYSPDGRFLAVVRFDRSSSSLKPVKVFRLPEPSPYAPSSLTQE